MDPKIVESELKNHKIREGPIYKRTKFLQEWRQNWMVLTMNYILIFNNRNLKELAQFVDLKEVKTYKSYLRKEEDMIPAGFKIRTLEDMFYFCARNCNEKWTWLVSLERVMDFKYAGKSPYNNADWIKTKGFMGQREFERGKFDEPEFDIPVQPEKPKEMPKPKEEPQVKVSGVDDEELRKKLKQVDEQLLRLHQREEDMISKEREQQEVFLFELNKLKKAEEALKELQIQVEERAREIEEAAYDGVSPDSKAEISAVIERAEEEARNQDEVRDAFEESSDIINQTEEESNKTSEQIMMAADEAANNAHVASRQSTTQPLDLDKLNEKSENSETTAVEKESESVEEKPETKQEQNMKMTESKTFSPEKKESNIATSEISSPGDEPQSLKKSSAMSKKILDMKSFFESKGSVMKPSNNALSNPLGSTRSKETGEKKAEKKNDTVAVHLCRDKVVVNLLEEFHPKAYNYPGLRYIIEFLITICAERSLGYQSFLIREAKAHQNRFLFAEVLLELINDFKKYDNFVCIAKIVEALIFEAPGIFKLNHYDLIKRKLVDLVNNAPEGHVDMPSLLKTLYLVHKMKNIEKDAAFKAKLTSISEKMASVEGKNWARKLIEDL